MYTDSEISGESFLLNLCKKAGKKCAFDAKDKDSFALWKKNTRESLYDCLGYYKIKGDSSTAELVSRETFSDYRRDKYILPTAENLKMPVYVLVPNETCGKVFIALHGHGSYGKEGIVGNHISGREAAENSNGEYGLELVRQGYITVCPDILGSGERASSLLEEPTARSACDLLNNALIALGMSLQTVVLFELTRLVEFSLSLKENKYKNVGVCGFSGGGLFSMWLTAMSDKVDIAVVSGYFHSQKDTCLQSNKCGCNFVPNFWLTADMGELAALAAPKPLYIELGSQDLLNGRSGLKGVYEQLGTAQKAYALFNAEQNIRLTLCDGMHKWYGSCYPFINKVVKDMEPIS